MHRIVERIFRSGISILGRNEGPGDNRMTRVSKNLMDSGEKSLQVVIWGLAAIIVLIPLIIAPQVLGGGKPDLFNIPRLTVMRLLTVVVLGAWVWWLIREG